MTRFILALPLCLAIAGCGQSPDQQLLSAQHALRKNRPRKALELAEQVVAAQPDRREALYVMAQSQVMVGQLGAARGTIERLIEIQDDDPDARELLVSWSVIRIDTVLRKSDFLTNRKYRDQFDQALEIGRRQANWLSSREGRVAEALFLQARFFDREIVVVDMQLANQQDSIRKPDEHLVRTLENKRKHLRLEIENTLGEAISEQRDFYPAYEMYVGVLAKRRAWSRLWLICQRLSEMEKLPATLIDQIVRVLILIPADHQPRALRLEHADRIVTAVRPEEAGSIDLKVAQARLHLVHGRYDEARTVLDEVISARSSHPNGRYLLAQALYHNGDYEEAKRILGKLSTQARLSDDVLTLYGMTLMKTGDTKMAKAVLMEAKALNPQNALAVEKLFELINAEQVLSEAGEDILGYYEDNPTDPRAIRLMVQFYQADGRRKELRARLDKQVQTIRPLLEPHLLILINGYSYLKDYEQAERFARKLVNLVPDEPAALLTLAESMLRQGRDRRVRRLLMKEREVISDCGSVDQMLGMLYLRISAFDDAVQLLEEVVVREPNNHNARLLLARALANVGLTDQALQHIDKVLEEAPDDVPALALSARICQLIGQEKQAGDRLDRIDVSKVDAVRYPGLLAQIKLHQGDLEKAAEICNRAITLGNGDALLRLILARVYTLQDKPHKTERQLLGLVASHPGNAQAYDLLARFYTLRQEIDKGLEQFQRIKLNGDDVLARLARAHLLMAARRAPEAVTELDAKFTPMLRERERRAITVADALARIHLSQRDVDAALKVYDRMIGADLLVVTARLRRAGVLVSAGRRDDALAALDEIAGEENLGEQARYLVMRRYTGLNQPDRAMAILDRWIADQGEHAVLLGWKGDLLVQMGKRQEAIEALRRAAEISPQAVGLRRRLAGVCVSEMDFPAAEAVLDEMAEIDANARVEALISKGAILRRLGLTEQAAKVFAELEKAGGVYDPRAVYAMGRLLADMKRYEDAIARLEEISPLSARFADAQILIAGIEHRLGRADPAQGRLQRLMTQRRFVPLIATRLLLLDIHDARDLVLQSWAVQAIEADALPPDLARRWQHLAVAVYSRLEDWDRLLAVLDQIDGASDAERARSRLTAIVVLLHLNRRGQAAETYRSAEALAASDHAPLVALLLAQPVTPNDQEPSHHRLVRALLESDFDRARSVAETMTGHPTIFPSDVRTMLEAAGDQASTARTARKTALAMLAHHTGLPVLADQLCREVMEAQPRMVVAQGVLIQALVEMRQPLDRVREHLEGHLPDSALALHLRARRLTAEGDFAGAAEALEQVLEREPGHLALRYDLSQMLAKAGEADRAISLLESLWGAPGRHRTLAGNDLAYLLAQHRPQRLEEARQIALACRKLDPRNPALADTIGWIEHLLGRTAEGLAMLNRVSAALGTVPDFHDHLGAMYAALGKDVWAGYHRAQAEALRRRTSASR
ncbi:MAG: hypothetical protein CMJ18_05055 [Phycisphaeraceae bacterium]|nr:hypothetical protein [Phycisphaeraceae bacterium]